MNVDLQVIILIFQGLTAFAVGMLGIIIQRSQQKIRQQELKFKLYEIRAESYGAVMEFVGKVVRNGNAPFEDCLKLLREGLKNEFLFGQEIQELIESLYKEGVDLQYLQSQIDAQSGITDVQKRTRLCEQYSYLLKKIAESHAEIRNKYKPYLNISVKD